MRKSSYDLTLAELLQDPITIAVMNADRVDPAGFEDMLRGVAGRLRHPVQEAIHAFHEIPPRPISLPKTSGCCGAA